MANRLVPERRLSGASAILDTAVPILREDDLDADLHRDVAETFDELAELLDGPTGGGLRLGIALAGGGDAAPAHKRTTRIQRAGRSG